MARKRLPDDFKEFLNSLNKNNVEYLLLGGWAVGIYSQPRATGDMDVLIAIDDANVDRLHKALCEFGAPTVDKSHFKEIGRIFRMGRPPMRIEIINQASGIDIKDCYARRKIVNVDGIAISMISREDLIKNKKAAGREKDLADVENLEEMPEK
jgi:predicted nucleotidyltransferase